MDATMLANAAAMTAVVMLLVSLLSPFVESIPAFADTPDNKARHDAALRLLNVVLNVAVVFVFAAASASGGLALADLLPLLVQALAQSAGAHFAYHVVTQGPAAGASGASDAPASSSNAAPDFPPGIPSLDALGLPLATPATTPSVPAAVDLAASASTAPATPAA